MTANVVRLKLDLAVTVPKDLEHKERNEDAWAVDGSVTKVALSDGASESFDSRTWANLLVCAYKEDPSFSETWLGRVLDGYLAAVDYEGLSWSKQAAFDRGSYATLLGLELAPNGAEVEVLAIGDSVAFHARGGSLLVSFPYTTVEEFDARPLLLSTLSANNTFVGEPGFYGKNTSSTWQVQAGDVIVLATDAVSQWALLERQPELNALSYLLNVASTEDFEAKVLSLRLAGRMRVDDSTMIRLVVED